VQHWRQCGPTISKKPPNKNMSVNVEDLRKIGFNVRELDIILKDQLEAIDDKLKAAAIGYGDKVLKYVLPDCIVSNMSKKDAQLYVYSKIIKSLKSRGFAVSLENDSDPMILVLRWSMEMSSADNDAMCEILRAASSSSSKADKKKDRRNPR
jgi:hypothetical protein